MSGAADPDLIERVAAGDREAFSQLVTRHRARVYRFLQTQTRDAATAEDALQETFLAVFRGADGFQGRSTVLAWIFGLARRQAARTWRRRAGEPTDTTPLDELAVSAGWGDPEKCTAVREDRARLRAALERLAPEDREVIVLRDLEQMSGPEAAQLLEIPLPALKSRLHRARIRLVAAARKELHHA